MGRNILSVTQVSEYLRSLFEDDALLRAVFVRGEVSNFKTYPSGHSYFTLKDAGASLRCVLFRREAAGLRFRPENGMKIIAFGRVAVYPRDGQYQLYCAELAPDGLGALYAAFEKLKAKLEAEGLFDEAHKKPLPRYPEKIALITSGAGAAVRDMLRILGARWPAAEIVLLPVRVQGKEAPGEIAAALRYAGENRVADLIITGRGGGSMEDLWAFNEEVVARAIYDCPVPVISAVGHEPDVTIADFVADLRAATPSNGAELAVPDRREVLRQVSQYRARMERAVRTRLSDERRALLQAKRALRSPEAYLNERKMQLDGCVRRLSASLQLALREERRRLAGAAGKLDAMSPLKVLGRGYAIATRGEAVLRDAETVRAGERIRVRLLSGALGCTVDQVEKET
ncbi:MAG TPA: exodeoxyribonuclease VII large subunit [Oscillospiraceae bacterium]|nr:exodeoxyribonuclease VII large subunit [Oscillospiraceae bacterium]